MKAPQYGYVAGAAMMLALAPSAQSGSLAPPFEVAFRAWDVVTQLARRNDDPTLSGDCGKTFQAAAVPGLRRQTQQEQDVAAAACLAAAQSACKNSKLKTTAQTVRACQEFR
jgi:hypothetical protein